MFESTHPLSDGNGRVGRMIMFKELLRIDTVPVVVRDSQKLLYYRGLRNFSGEPGYLVDTLLSERDYYRDRFIEQLAPGRIEYTYVDTWDRTPSSGVILRSRRITPSSRITGIPLMCTSGLTRLPSSRMPPDGQIVPRTAGEVR